MFAVFFILSYISTKKKSNAIVNFLHASHHKMLAVAIYFHYLVGEIVCNVETSEPSWWDTVWFSVSPVGEDAEMCCRFKTRLFKNALRRLIVTVRSAVYFDVCTLWSSTDFVTSSTEKQLLRTNDVINIISKRDWWMFCMPMRWWVCE